MTQYKIFNITFSISKLNKSKSGIKNGTEVTLTFSSNTIGDSKMRLIFHIYYYQLIRKFRAFGKLLQTVHQLT